RPQCFERGPRRNQVEEAVWVLSRPGERILHSLRDRREYASQRGRGLTRRRCIRHEFVEFIPELLDEGTLYVSIPYATAAHLCCCGCAMKGVTPISPTDRRGSYHAGRRS